MMGSDKDLFFEALDLPTREEQLAFLDHACRSDPNRRQRVDELLTIHYAQNPFMKEAVLGSASKTSPPDSVKSEGPGTQIGHYKILEKIGEGGFGTVYVAEQKEPVKRRVALKIIKLGMDTRQMVARFEVERQALAMMDHPNIARVFEAGATETGRPYFVMELVCGVRITDYCVKNELPTVERLKLFMLVCHAIQHAHQKGIIHRDIKPSNILVTLQDGAPVPKVIDFGIAKATQDNLVDTAIYTRLQQFIGTPAYMSPEQAEMSTLNVDTRTDIYALGVMLYELLVGKTPFDATELMECGLDEMRRTIREKEPTRPSTRLSQTLAGHDLKRSGSQSIPVPAAQRRLLEIKKTILLITGDLDWIVMKCLEKDRARRYETANGLARDIQRHLNNEPISAAAPSTSYKLRKFARRNRRAVGVGLAIAALFMAGITTSTVLAIRASKAEHRASLSNDESAQTNRKLQDQLAATEKQGLRADSEKLIAERHLYAARMNLAQRAEERNDLDRLRLILSQTADAPEHGFEWFYFQREFHFALKELRGPRSMSRWLAFSPDGRQLVTGLEDHTARIWDVETETELKTLTGHQAAVSTVSWSANGLWIVSGSFDGTTKLWDAKSGRELTAIETGINAPILCSAISHDNGRVAIGADNGSVGVWQIPSGKEVIKIKADTTPVTSVAFSARGERFATSSDAGGRIWETLTGQLVTQFTGKDLRIGRLDWSPNGERIVTADHEGSHARIWDIPNGRELFSTWEVDESTWAVAFSPDSGQFAVSTGGGMLKIRSALDGHEASSLNTGQPAFAVAFSPDGRRLAYTTSGNRTMVRALANPFGSSIRLSHSLNTNGIGPGSLGSKSAVCVAFSPDSKEIVTGGRDKLAKVWEASTGRELSILKGHIGAVTSVAFSADGSRIVTRGDDGTARVWERATGQELLQFKVGEFAGFSFSKDGARIVGVQDSDAVIWDASNGVELLRVDADVRTAILSTDGKHLLAGTGRNTVDLWDVGTAKKLRTLTSHTATVWAIAFSPDGKTIVSGGLDRTPVVWDAVTGRMLRRLEGHSGPIWSVAFSGDGKRIVTGSADQTTRLWDAETGLELLVLPGQTDVRAAISPNGRYIASLDGDSVRVWIAASPEEMETWNQSGK